MHSLGESDHLARLNYITAVSPSDLVDSSECLFLDHLLKGMLLSQGVAVTLFAIPCASSIDVA